MVRIVPGQATLADWRSIYRGAPFALDAGGTPIWLRAARPQSRRSPRIRRAGLRHQHRLRQAGQRAHRPRGPGDPAAEHRALARGGGGRADAAPVVRLMMALKVASLAHGASGVRPETIELLVAMLERDLLPVVPSQGSVGASGDLAPLAHMAAAMIGVGEVMCRRRSACRPRRRWRRPGCSR